MSGNWYILYTKPGQEKKVSTQLSKKGYESFCPLNYPCSNTADRKRFNGEPLFPRFVFVYLAESQILTIRNFTGVIQLVHWLSKPAIIKDDEIRVIREFTRIHNNIDISKSFVDSQEDCMVTTVPFMQGDKHSIAPRKAIIKVFLPSLGFTMTAQAEQEEISHMPLIKSGLKMVS
ncbi:MAG: UpxY family transcription antiterminator [Ferruginibacter sp.]